MLLFFAFIDVYQKSLVKIKYIVKLERAFQRTYYLHFKGVRMNVKEIFFFARDQWPLIP